MVAVGEEVLSRLNAASGGARIVVTTAYDPSDGTGDAGAAGLLWPWPEGPAVVRALNAALTGLARRHGALVADVHGWFLGRGATAGAPSQVLSRPASRNLWYCHLIEPNAWGVGREDDSRRPGDVRPWRPCARRGTMPATATG